MILHTERLILREFVADDWKAVHAYQSLPEYLRYYDREESDEHDARAFVYLFIRWQAEKPRIRTQLAITLEETGELIGNVGIRRAEPDDPVADMGYELSPRHWGHGYATEAGRAMLAWAFDDLGLARVHAHCVADNRGSVRVLERLGMRHEGTLREHRFYKGRRWDVLLFGMLREEWNPTLFTAAGD